MSLHHKVSCVFGNHRRQADSIWDAGRHYHAVCRGCGVEMLKDLNGWRLAKKTERIERPQQLAAHGHHWHAATPAE